MLPHGHGGVLPVHPGPWWWQQPIRVFLTRFLAAMPELASQSKSVTRHDTAYTSRHVITTYPAAHSLLVSYLSQQEFASDQGTLVRKSAGSLTEKIGHREGQFLQARLLKPPQRHILRPMMDAQLESNPYQGSIGRIRAVSVPGCERGTRFAFCFSP